MKNDEIIIREMIRDESEAVAHYTKAALNISCPKIRQVLEDIKKEEIVHIGELKAVLNNLLHINDEFKEREGAEEAAETIEKASVMNKPLSVVNPLMKAHDLLHDFKHNPIFNFKHRI